MKNLQFGKSQSLAKVAQLGYRPGLIPLWVPDALHHATLLPCLLGLLFYPPPCTKFLTWRKPILFVFWGMYLAFASTKDRQNICFIVRISPSWELTFLGNFRLSGCWRERFDHKSCLSGLGSLREWKRLLPPSLFPHALKSKFKYYFLSTDYILGIHTDINSLCNLPATPWGGWQQPYHPPSLKWGSGSGQGLLLATEMRSNVVLTTGYSPPPHLSPSPPQLFLILPALSHTVDEFRVSSTCHPLPQHRSSLTLPPKPSSNSLVPLQQGFANFIVLDNHLKSLSIPLCPSPETPIQ